LVASGGKICGAPGRRAPEQPGSGEPRTCKRTKCEEHGWHFFLGGVISRPVAFQGDGDGDAPLSTHDELKRRDQRGTLITMRSGRQSCRSSESSTGPRRPMRPGVVVIDTTTRGRPPAPAPATVPSRTLGSSPAAEAAAETAAKAAAPPKRAAASMAACRSAWAAAREESSGEEEEEEAVAPARSMRACWRRSRKL